MLSEEIVQQNLNNTTHFYLSVEEENKQDTRRNYIYICHGLIYPRNIEIVASNNLFPTSKSSHGNTCSQLFMGTISDRWSIYCLGKESQNGTAIQDYLSQVEVSPVIKTDNEYRELEGKCTDH